MWSTLQVFHRERSDSAHAKVRFGAQNMRIVKPETATAQALSNGAVSLKNDSSSRESRQTK